MQRCAWTGGSVPPEGYNTDLFRVIRRERFREQIADCGGLDLWKCAGTSSMERARIFWQRAKYDAWATIRNAGFVD